MRCFLLLFHHKSRGECGLKIEFRSEVRITSTWQKKRTPKKRKGCLEGYFEGSKGEAKGLKLGVFGTSYFIIR